jgi:hypothetical protein
VFSRVHVGVLLTRIYDGHEEDHTAQQQDDEKGTQQHEGGLLVVTGEIKNVTPHFYQAFDQLTRQHCASFSGKSFATASSPI